MTKKSQARLQRDAYKNNNTAWDDITEIYKNNHALHNEVATQVRNFFSIPNVADFTPTEERGKTAAALRTIDSDLEVFAKDLAMIYKGHAGRSGPLLPEDDIMQVLALSEAYMNYSTRFEAIVSPTYTYLVSIMGAVEANAAKAAKADEEAAQAALFDPTVITDVEVKTTESAPV